MVIYIRVTLVILACILIAYIIIRYDNVTFDASSTINVLLSYSFLEPFQKQLTI